MTLFQPTAWPLWIAFGLMLVGIVVNLSTLKSPNWLSLTALLGGYATAVAIQIGLAPATDGSFASSFACSLLAGGLLVPIYLCGLLGAGCVKMQAALGAWIGAALPLADGVWTTAVATLAGCAATACAAWLVHSMKQTSVQQLTNELGEQARPSSGLLPAQTTLSVGGLAGVMAIVAGWL